MFDHSLAAYPGIDQFVGFNVGKESDFCFSQMCHSDSVWYSSVRFDQFFLGVVLSREERAVSEVSVEFGADGGGGNGFFTVHGFLLEHGDHFLENAGGGGMYGNADLEHLAEDVYAKCEAGDSPYNLSRVAQAILCGLED